jgi:D-cysteine desulfhydrase family pyridoxal phosphate-dependent enzyme
MMWKIFRTPRYRLVATLPTPLERANRLGEDLGIELYIKRDDVMELAMGGNKVRKLEFILGDALSRGSDTLITRGAIHSNHARLTAAAARKAGLDVYLVLTPPGSREPQGNLLLDMMLGANVIFAEETQDADKIMQDLARVLEEKGRKPYVIPGGGASPHGVLGYAMASLEIIQQLYMLGKKPMYIVHATGTGATQAGLILGMRMLGASDVAIIGISNGRKKDEVRERIYRLVRNTMEIFSIDVKIDSDDIVVFDDYIFGGYASITKEVVETLKLVARREGLILDPVYTAKAMYGLIDLVKRGYIDRRSTVVFLHTGGTPINFQYSSIISRYMQHHE